MFETREGDDEARVRNDVRRSDPQPPELTPSERRQALRRRHGGFDWIATFLGFTVATFFLIVLFGIVAAVAGAVGYQLQGQVPTGGGRVSGATAGLGLGIVVASLVAVLIAYFIGGYAAGRLARFDGFKNGLAVVGWAVVLAIIFGVLGAVLGSSFNVANQLHLSVSTGSLTLAGIVSLIVTLLVMLTASGLGGWVGARYHKSVDRDFGAAP